MNKYLLLILLGFGSFGVVADEETFICKCDNYISDDMVLKSCNSYPKGLIIDSAKNTLSFKDEKYFYRNNPNTLSSRGYLGRKNADDFLVKETVTEIEFEKITNMLTWSRTDTYFVVDEGTKRSEISYWNDITEYFICEST